MGAVPIAARRFRAAPCASDDSLRSFASDHEPRCDGDRARTGDGSSRSPWLAETSSLRFIGADHGHRMAGDVPGCERFGQEPSIHIAGDRQLERVQRRRGNVDDRPLAECLPRFQIRTAREQEPVRSALVNPGGRFAAGQKRENSPAERRRIDAVRRRDEQEPLASAGVRRPPPLWAPHLWAKNFRRRSRARLPAGSRPRPDRSGRRPRRAIHTPARSHCGRSRR